MIGENILFIGIGFYDYDQLIIQKLESYGANVTYVCQEHSFRSLKRLSKFTFFKKIERNFSSKYLLNQFKKNGNFDKVFVIKGDKLSKVHLGFLKVKNPNAKFIMYQWDSIERFTGHKAIFSFFDDIYSFDRQDCAKYGFNFLPLFYRKSQTRLKTYSLDLSFVGWLHFNRLELLSKLEVSLKKADMRPVFYLYTSYKNWLLHNCIKKKKFVHFKALEYSDYLKIINESNAILDFHHPNQNGLTIRTIEALGANKKILTTNKDIVNYDFYSKNNCLIISSNTTAQNIIDFLRVPYEELDPKIHCKYSFNRWFSELFGIEGEL